MIWRPAGRSRGRRLLTYLRTDEWKHVALSSRIREAGERPRFGNIGEGRIWIREEGLHVTGALYISRYGVVLPAYDIAPPERNEAEFLRKTLVGRRDRLFSVIGMDSRVRDVESRLGEIPPDVETYRMFTGEVSLGLPGNHPPELSLHRAGPEDLDRLWPLEKSYQIEEVLRKGSFLNERSGRRHFLENLRNQMIFYAALNGRPVAKAGTNARGWSWDQIGGVFVVPEFRGRGFARSVMDRLLDEIRRSGRKPCLFVKDGNDAALGLYHRLNFRDRGAFRISYWSN